MSEPPADNEHDWRSLKDRIAAGPREASADSGIVRSASETKRHYDIERKWLGRIVRIVSAKSFGFIASDDFRSDVFFHFDRFEPVDMDRTYDDGTRVGMSPNEGLWVEFEIDHDHRRETDQLRASAVRPTRRPTPRKLSGRDATFDIVTHHPKARRKKPTWRK